MKKFLLVLITTLFLFSCAAMQKEVNDIYNDLTCDEICMIIDGVGQKFWDESKGEDCNMWCPLVKNHIDANCLIDSVKNSAKNIDRCIK